MSDFTFLQNSVNGKWVVSAPRRSLRTNVGKVASICPFCPGPSFAKASNFAKVSMDKSAGKQDVVEDEVYRVGDIDAWKILVLKNKFPFAPHHELIIHSPDHHKNWDELPFSQIELILQTYRQRFIVHKKNGQVYLFHNRGHAAGESIPHPHTQLVVIPYEVKLDIPPLDQAAYNNKSSIFHLPFSNNFPLSIDKSKNSKINGRWKMDDGKLETEHFLVSCPQTSEWPDEVWIAPKENGGGFGFIKDHEITDLAFVLSRLIQIFDIRNGHEFAFNFYIASLKNWYLRFIPRKKIIGGFELGTNIIVNTQDPRETFGFIREHFWKPDREHIKSYQNAKYRTNV
jgi:UDPglucose--hexose-1-phosphate uridylyltransferase